MKYASASCNRQTRISGGLLVFTLALAGVVRSDDEPKNRSTPKSEESQPKQGPSVGTKTGEAWNSNGIKMEFLWCEPGKFVMGSPPNEADRANDEDQVEVELTKGFWLGKFEVTQSQWRTVMNSTPWDGQIRVRVAPDSPVTWVNWDNAQLFCREFTQMERKNGNLPDDWEYILPTEAQWEYACRAGTTTRYSFGNDIPKLFDYAWYGEQEREPKEMNPRAVGRKKPNPWGFYDMHGNTMEWVRDWYTPKFPGGKDPFIATDVNHRVTLRGGDWRREQFWSRSAARESILPGGITATVGFRASLQQCTPDSQNAVIAATKVAVVSFENRGNAIAYDRLGHAFAGMLASELSKFAALDVMERQSAKELLDEAALAKTGLAQGSNAGKRTQHADYILTGSCAVTEQKLTVTARLERTGIAGAVAAWTLQGSLDELARLQTDLSQKVVETLKISRDIRIDPPAATGQSPVMAILPFVNNSPTNRLDDMKLGLPDLLQASLSENKNVRLVERQQIDKILAEQSLSLSGQVDTKTAVQIGKLAGAERLLAGSFLEINKQLSIQARIINTATGAVVNSTSVIGQGDQFSELIDELSRRVLSNLEVALPESTEAEKQTKFGRTLESAVHAAAAKRFVREGNRSKAIESYQQALLVVPYDMGHINELLVLLGQSEDWETAVKVGEQALSYPKMLEPSPWKQHILAWVTASYAKTGRHEAAKQLSDKYGGQSDYLFFQLFDGYVNALIKAKRYPDAVQIMEQMAEKDVEKNGVLRSEGLKRLSTFYRIHSTSIVGISIKEHQISAEKAIKLYDRVLESLQGVQNEDAVKWSHYLIGLPQNLLTISDDNQRVHFLNEKQREEYDTREKEFFSWMQEAGTDRVDQLFELAIKSEKAEAWQEAVDTYRKFVEQTVNMSAEEVCPSFIKYYDWMDRRIEAEYRIARILSTKLDRMDEAVFAYQSLVREYGLSHFAGPDVIVDMHRLNLTPKIPARSALIWGGSTSNLIGWRKLLNAQDLSVHPLRKHEVTLADLAPYRLVILCNSDKDGLSPSDVIALRTYVAAGGSLLVVVSPIWDPAAVVIHNSLLTLFNMEVTTTLGERLNSTSLATHSITQGISKFTAFHPVGLRCAEQAALVSAGDQTLLAAQAHQYGRIVVAGIGQWYTPEVLLIPEMNQPPRKTSTYTNFLQGDFSKIRGTAPEPPLLRQVIQWLDQSHNDDPLFKDWRKEWQSALVEFSLAQSSILPKSSRIRDWDTLPEVFDQLVGSVPDANLKEISLWTAGECLLHKGYFRENFSTQEASPRYHRAERQRGRQWYREVLPCDPKYFQQLVEQGSDGPLFAYAQVRHADALAMTDPEPVRHIEPKKGRNLSRLAAPYRKLELAKGTYPYAWAKLELGCLLFGLEDFEQAAECFNEVAESMPISAEKGLAIINSAYCHILRNDFSGANRRLEQLQTFPSIAFPDGFAHYHAESNSTGQFLSSSLRDSQYIGNNIDVRYMGNNLKYRMERLEKNNDFQKWVQSHKSQKKTGTGKSK